MKRRDFCKLLAGAASSALMPPEAGARTKSAADAPVAFDALTENYATFCNTPAKNRLFFKLRGSRIVKEKLNDKIWRPDTIRQMQHVPRLPVPGGSWYGVPLKSPIPGLAGDGPYKPTWDSLLQYECPEWFRDAKFGIWNHWSPQCVPEDGDWYARLMYIQGSQQYKYNLRHYGHPSVFGYKDLCPQWTLLNWEPDKLMASYKRAGARLFLALANHHDGFDTWNSRHHPWNAHNIGPHRDVIGTWAKVARESGLRFGVTVHQAYNWWWFQTSHGADSTGPMAGVPYDGDLTKAQGMGQWWEGFDPQQLYGPKHPPDALPDISYVKNFYDRTRDLVDQHNPDVLYFDNPLFPLGWAGMNIGAYFYNRNLRLNGGKMEGVINIKGVPGHLLKCVVGDIERGVTNRIMRYPWQSETCIGDWHYQRALFNVPGRYGGYLSPRDVIHWMIDAVSKNGTFILNIPGKPDGTIDRKEQLILEEIGNWFQINGEAIYATRPWKIYGEGPTVMQAGSMHGKSISRLGAMDIRFTRNKANTIIYALALGWPRNALLIHALGSAAATNPGKIQHVELLGTAQKLNWSQSAVGLHVELPGIRPTVDYAIALKVIL